MKNITITLVFTLVALLSSHKSQANFLSYCTTVELTTANNHFNPTGERIIFSDDIFSTNLDSVKKPWWLLLIGLEVKFGTNHPNCKCCYTNSLCSITSNKTVKNNFETVEQLVDYLDKTNHYFIAVNDKKEIFILTSSKNPELVFKSDGFSLEYLPNIDDDIRSKLDKVGANLKNLKLNKKYSPVAVEGGYTMIKLS